jgi:hypothetical protein
VPLDSFASANSRPPWASMMDPQIDSPMPTPLDFVPASSAGSTSTASSLPIRSPRRPPLLRGHLGRLWRQSPRRRLGVRSHSIDDTLSIAFPMKDETTASALSPFSGQSSLNLRTWTRGSNSRLRSRNGRELAHQAILRLPTRPRLMGRGSQRRESLPSHLGALDTGL